VKVLFNNKISEDLVSINTNDRALQFGDGLFETIIVSNHSIRHFNLHFDRLTRGMTAINLDSSTLKKEQLKNDVFNLIETNKLNKPCRVKIMVWRRQSEKGGYSTSSKEYNLLITVKETTESTMKIIESSSVSKNVQLSFNSISKYKTISALPYVVASIERDQRKLDELILTNNNGYIAEAISSNLFWINGNQIFTPPVSTGCVEGVMRTHLINLFKNEGKPIIENNIEYEDLLNQEVVFTANVAGISIIRHVDEKEFKTSHPTLEQIKQLLAL
jgi:4-amino-4-deoxychorismate lyase